MNNDYSISDDKKLLQIDVIHGFLKDSYWSKGISKELVENSIKHSHCFGVYKNGRQIGFARLITDYTKFAYLADVFILEEFRGLGYSKKLMEVMINNPLFKNLKRWMLHTSDAHGLYKQFGFKISSEPEKYMELRKILEENN